jgi:glycerol-3-phosphate dehydrogenase
MSLSQPLDVCVIGGGITGAGIVLDATRRGLKAALFEQHDFGYGASTATSKLAHGGLRYLEQRQFKLVRESLMERNFLLKSAPHLVKPLRFFVPIYTHSRWSAWRLRLGLNVYDWLQSKGQLPKHSMLDARGMSFMFPWLTTTDAVACGCYYVAHLELGERGVLENTTVGTTKTGKQYLRSKANTPTFDNLDTFAITCNEKDYLGPADADLQ